MKILEIYMKNFGKFSDRRIFFHDGINLLYGKNEAGKSTIYAFLRAMLFGIEKARGRAAKSDMYNQCQPWENPGYFAGSMRFESGGKIFRLERNFHSKEKRVSLICETDGEELSVENGDLTVLLEGLSADAYDNTFFISQKGASGSRLAGELHAYMSNLEHAGDAGIDVKGALKLLDARRRQAEAEKKKVQEAARERMKEQQARLDYVAQEEERLRDQEAECEERLRKVEEERAEAGRKIRAQESREKACQTQGARARETCLQREEDGSFPKKGVAAVLVLGILALLGSLLLPGDWVKYVAVPVYACVVVGILYGVRRGRGQDFSDEEAFQGETENLGDSVKGEAGRAEAPGRAEDREAERIAEEWRSRLERLSYQAEKLWGRLEHIRVERREKQALRENLMENLREISEEGDGTGELDREIAALRLAASSIEEASREVYSQWEGRLNRRVSQILEELTGGRYTKVFLNEDLQICIQTPERILAIWQVSRGTMEQVYFALRMAAGEIFTGGEQVPVILDEAFGMYDEERLEQTLRWLQENKEQVILFTCQEREGRILEKMQSVDEGSW